MAARVAVVQIADNLALHDLSDPELDRLGETAAGHGVTLEVGTRTVDPDHLSRYIELAQRIGARALRTVLSGPRRGADAVEAVVAAIQPLVPELDRSGVVLVLENNEVFAASHYAAIMRKISAPCVGICLDTANSLGRPELLDTVLDNLAEHTLMLHAKDYDLCRIDTRMGFSVAGAPAGQGRVDFDHVLSVLGALKREPTSAILEHWPPFLGDIETTIRNEEEWFAQSLGFLRPKVDDHPPASSRRSA